MRRIKCQPPQEACNPRDHLTPNRSARANPHVQASFILSVGYPPALTYSETGPTVDCFFVIRQGAPKKPPRTVLNYFPTPCERAHGQSCYSTRRCRLLPIRIPTVAAGKLGVGIDFVATSCKRNMYGHIHRDCPLSEDTLKHCLWMHASSEALLPPLESFTLQQQQRRRVQ